MSTDRASAVAGTPSAVPRTLAEDLRARSDDALAALLRERPDLVTPVPADVTQLAARAATRASVVRALDQLDRFALQTAEALAVVPDGGPVEVLFGLMGTPTEAVAGALGTLRERALVWGAPERPRLVRAARDLLAPPGPGAPATATGLGPTTAELLTGPGSRISPARAQELLRAAGLPSTHDQVSAATALTGLFSDAERLRALLADAPEGTAGLLERLTWGPPFGEVGDSGAAPPAPARPVPWLLARGVLLPAGPRTVALPREAALSLRGGRAHRTPEPVPPAVTARAGVPARDADAAGAAEAFAAVRTVEELLAGWSAGGPPVLRAGGLGVRDLKRTAVALDVPEPEAAFWIELAFAAGLAASDGEADETYVPTPAYDEWTRRPTGERWTALVTAWLAATRVPGLVGARDPKGRVLAALGPGLDRSPAPALRGRVLGLLAGLPAGSVAEPGSLLARLRWERPPRTGAGAANGGPAAGAPAAGVRRPGAASSGTVGGGAPGAAETTPGGEALREALLGWTLAEAERLGVTGRGALTSYARPLLGAETGGASGTAGVPGASGASSASGASGASGAASANRRTGKGTSAAGPIAPDPARAARLLTPLLPTPLDHVLLQGDLTAVAPGPLETPLAEALGAMADVESKGGATVYRFTPESVRRALDGGRTASDLHDLLARHSRTPVPQPLGYLIDDVARRHGRLRVGAASAYVRCDDDALLGELLADRRAAGLGLRRLAPTVLAARCEPSVLLERLRALGHAPAAESAEGDVLLARADAHRTPPRMPPVPVLDGPPVPAPVLLAAAVRALRAGDRAESAAPAGSPAAPAASASGADGANGLAEPPRSAAADTLALLQAAVLTGDAVWIGYVTPEGAASRRVIEPVRVEGGFVTAYDHGADRVRTFAVHRITGAAEIPPETP
jgi:hypothetical protein